ncbi:MAG: hypothetical protein CVU91_01680 [Firmicutes bacterium HGW-Firmicutes-16]|nr:MAG: hypothetical protein CVU91_01680 [Firmicutes bacterium HGW-Firmicutes-16]
MQQFVKNPNLPSGKVTAAAIGEAYADKLCAALEQFGVRLFRCPNNLYVDTRLSSHIDLSFFHIGGKRFLLSKSASESSFEDELKQLGAEIIVSEKRLAPEYPNDAFLCALSIGGRVFHNTKLTDPNIRTLFPSILFHVKQGYAKCAVCPVTENAAISSDQGLSKAMREQGIEVLEIASGYIALEGFAEGFIGGSAFKIAPDKLAFTGRLDRHPDKPRVEEFLSKHGIFPVYLTDKPVFDVGSIIPIIEI